MYSRAQDLEEVLCHIRTKEATKPDRTTLSNKTVVDSCSKKCHKANLAI